MHDGADALDYFQCAEYDVVVLDIMMPKVNGLEVLHHIRKCRSSVPVLMLTAKAEIEDRVAGLEAGADDYLPKPFATKEFIARVKALSRRNAGYTDLVLSLKMCSWIATDMNLLVGNGQCASIIRNFSWQNYFCSTHILCFLQII